MQRPFRLRHTADFDRVRTQGQAWRHPFLTLAALPNDLAYNRFGFITSRRLGNAVTRNRVRRVLRELVRRAMPQLKPGYDITLIARNEIVDQPYTKIDEALYNLLERANLIAR